MKLPLLWRAGYHAIPFFVVMVDIDFNIQGVSATVVHLKRESFYIQKQIERKRIKFVDSKFRKN